MFCLLVSPDPLCRALLLSESEQQSPASQTVAVVGGAAPTTPPAISHHVAVVIPDEYNDGGYDSDAAEELETTQEHISPVRRALVRAVFVTYTAFLAPALVTMTFTRSNSCLQALIMVVVPVGLTIVSLFMATVRVFEDEDREREEEEQGLKGL